MNKNLYSVISVENLSTHSELSSMKKIETSYKNTGSVSTVNTVRSAAQPTKRKCCFIVMSVIRLITHSA